MPESPKASAALSPTNQVFRQIPKLQGRHRRMTSRRRDSECRGARAGLTRTRQKHTRHEGRQTEDRPARRRARSNSV